MKKNLLFSLLIAGFSNLAIGQENDTVSLNAGYTDEAWYSLDNGVVVSSPVDDWEIAFETSPQGASIIINAASGVELYLAGDTSIWSSLTDTSGLSTWPRQFNSDTSWYYGAFNYSATGHPNYGWGTYNSVSHIVTGDKIFVLKMPDGSYQKIWIKDVTLGEFTFEHAHLGGTHGMTHTVKASDFSGKNFGYFSLANHQQVDKEPMAADWDLKFDRYIDLGQEYLVSGVRHNIDVKSAKAYPVNDPASYVDYQSETFMHAIATIGHDWKTFNMSTFQYDIADSTVYFVEARGGDIWKLIFDGFGGSANGNMSFTKEKLLEVGIDDVQSGINTFGLYPNPASDNVTLAYKNFVDARLEVRDVSGKLVYSNVLTSSELTHTFSVQNLQPGMYLVAVIGSDQIDTQKLLVR